MFFASPIWLALLLPPWAAAAVWLMWSRRGERTDVPFIALWRGGTAESPRERRQFRPPPIALIAALAAVLLAIIASARPKLEVGSAGEGPLVTVVLDRGVTMAVGDRIAEVIAAARPVVLEAFGEGPTDLIEVPDGTSQRVTRSAWSQVASRATPTQEQTRDAVQFAVQRALAKTDGPIVVLSDQPIRDDPRVVQIAPSKPLQNVAIEKFVVRESPRPQAMVTVVNYSDQPRATVRVRSGERTLVERAIDLPRAPGGEATVFLDLPSLDSSAVAEIEAADDLAIDNIAHAKRQRSFPSIEVRAPVPAEVRRVAEAYAKARSAHQTSVTIAIVDENSIASDFPSAIVSTSAVSGGGGAVIVAAHPVSAGVDWADAKLQAADVPPGENWRAIVSVGGRGVVAVRESPQRQVWVGFHASDEFARTPEFVIFWTNVFDWLAGGDDGGADAAQHWSSTVIPPIRIAPPSATEWRAKLSTLKPTHPGATDITSPVLLLSVICLILAAGAWPGRSLTPISVPRTV